MGRFRALAFVSAAAIAACTSEASPGGSGGSDPAALPDNASVMPGAGGAPTAAPGTTPTGLAGTDGVAGGSPSPTDTLGEMPVDGSDEVPIEPALPPPAACTGMPGAPGTNTRTVMNGALNRTFIVHVPPGLDPNTPVPVLFAFHGFTMSGQVMHDLTAFTAIADREGFIAVFPDGGGAAPWNVGTGICGVGAVVGGTEDDLGFLEKMIDAVAADQCIDRERVFVTGFSMGGYFSNHVGCQKSGVVRAVAPASGGTYMGDCPGGPMPVLLLHGMGDALIAPLCGTQARDLWVQRNGCSTEFDSVPVMGGHCEQHRGCPPGGQVTLCLFDSMAHGWAGASQQGATGFYGGGTQFENATELVWKFFSEQ
jgi:polyhydroxybutyrate depolymerase